MAKLIGVGILPVYTAYIAPAGYGAIELSARERGHLRVHPCAPGDHRVVPALLLHRRRCGPPRRARPPRDGVHPARHDSLAPLLLALPAGAALGRIALVTPRGSDLSRRGARHCGRSPTSSLAYALLARRRAASRLRDRARSATCCSPSPPRCDLVQSAPDPAPDDSCSATTARRRSFCSRCGGRLRQAACATPRARPATRGPRSCGSACRRCPPRRPCMLLPRCRPRLYLPRPGPGGSAGLLLDRREARGGRSVHGHGLSSTPGRRSPTRSPTTPRPLVCTASSPPITSSSAAGSSRASPCSVAGSSACSPRSQAITWPISLCPGWPSAGRCTGSSSSSSSSPAAPR